ncbi:hypothetical protein [Bradyrhizobium yuanmingense]|uniref:hypothetical protein n=1 Tax=Bradyrhizobium yuanmingense TaxID=108015 RepID=UPI0023B90E54|nr:hypothetical protein [Bradyrhizobium yuanmingense]MDF0492756.1 hypothetical protein [Bradyrhizobium yuanmingense]
MFGRDRVAELWSAANYLSLNLLYGRRYLAPGEPISLDDVPEFCPGHWGCVPGLNFVWANLVVGAATMANRIVPLVGTGHGGAAWVAWSLIVRADKAGLLSRAELDRVIGSFGDDDVTPPELFGPIPGLVWPSGELGYSLGFAQGASAELDDRIVVILGDGELETGCTLSGLAAGPMLPDAPLVIINANGFRMGSVSWFAQLADHGRELLGGLGWKYHLVKEGDVERFQAALRESSKEPTVIVYANQKGGEIPPLQGSLRNNNPVHKLPIKQLNDNRDCMWLRGWLDTFAVGFLSNEGLSLPFGGLLRDATCGLADAQPRGRTLPVGQVAIRQRRSGDVASDVELFMNEIAHQEPDGLVISPDEANSNLVDGSGLDVREFLSEQLTFAWAIGASAAGRTAFWVTYEAFAPLINTMLSQYTRHLASGGQPRRLPCVIVTSLSWRNVPSHQDLGFCNDIERRGLGLVTVIVPHTRSYVNKGASLALNLSKTRAAIPIVFVEKYLTGADELDVAIECGPHRDGWATYRFGTERVGSRKIALVAFGAVQFREATRAARYLVEANATLVCDVLALWLVNPSSSDASRANVLLADYDKVGALAGMGSLTWDRALASVRLDGRLVHDATFAPTTGPNEVTRLLKRELDWLALAASIARSINEKSISQAIVGARESLQKKVDRSRTARWYSDCEWNTLLKLLGLAS